MLKRLVSKITPLLTKSCLAPPLARQFAMPYKTERILKDLTFEDLVNRRYIRQILRSKITGQTMKSQRGLYHGRKTRTGHSITYSDKRIKRRFNPHVTKMTFHSEILNKNVKLNVTHKAFRCIKKYGSFDNYILLTKPENMQSLFGEYLRKIMLQKLNNPNIDFHNCQLFGLTPDVFRGSKKFTYNKDRVWFPREIRHTDQTMRFWRGLNQMTKEELRLVSLSDEGNDRRPCSS